MQNTITSTPQQPPDLIGRGWAFPLQLSHQGKLHCSGDRTNIQEAIQIILRTRLGERVYRPDFGSRLHELVFEPINSSTLTLAVVYIEEALRRWEPRIDLENIETFPDLEQGRIDVTIAYRIKATRNRHSLVYPFYLASPDS